MDSKAAPEGYYADHGQLKDHFEHLKPSYEAGEVIYSATPYAYIVISSFKGRFCDNCIAPATPARGLTKCTGCDYESYCGPDCRSAAWAFHRFECPLLAQWRRKGRTWAELLDQTRLLFRVLSRRQTEGNGAPRVAVEGAPIDFAGESAFPAVQGPGWRPSFDDLISHAEDLESHKEVYLPVLENFTEFCAGAEEPLAFELPPRHEIVAAYGRIRSNWFDLCDGRLWRIGQSIYLSPSVINHSCLANTTAITFGLRVDMRTLRKVEAAKEEPRYSYVVWERLPSTAERQEYFMHEYFFQCKCPLCDGSPAAKKRDARLTSGRCIYGDDCRLKSECDYCLAGEGGGSAERKLADEEVKKVIAALEDAEKKADYRAVVNIATGYLNSDPALGVCNGQVVLVREILVRACYELEDSWEVGVKAARVLLDVYGLLYPAWPVLPVGKLTFIMGVMLLRGGHSKEAAEYFRKALDITRVILSSEHDYVKEIERLREAALGQSASGRETKHCNGNL